MNDDEFEEIYQAWLKENVKAISDVELLILVESEKLNLTEEIIQYWIGMKCPDCGVPLERREYVIGHHLAGHFEKIPTPSTV